MIDNPERPQNKYLIPYKKGQSGNPLGRPKLPDHLREIKELTATELNRQVAKYARMEAQQVAQAAKDPTLPALEAAIASTFTMAIRKGEASRLQIFLDRAIPKPKDPPIVDINVNLASLSNQELIEMAKDAINILSRSDGTITKIEGIVASEQEEEKPLDR